jgi:iron(III) transport system substrate-binding protein
MIDGRITVHLLIVSCFVFSLSWPAISSGATKEKAYPSSKSQELARLIEEAKKEGKVIWWDSLKIEESVPVIKAFEAKYPFIKVEHVRIHATESRERMLRELMTGKVDFDVCDIAGEQISAFKQSALLEKYDWTKAFDVRPELLDRDQMLLAIGAIVGGVGYNTNLVSRQNVPTRWEDLLDAKWKGKLVVDTRPKTFVHLMPAWGEERVLEYLKKLAVNKPKFRRGQTETIQLMAAGELPMIAGTYRHSLMLIKKTTGAPLDVALLDVIGVNLEKEAIVKNAPHPNAAKLLLGWLATEGQKYYDETTSRGIPLPGFDTELSKRVKGKTISLFVKEWSDREAELLEKALKALGRE